MITILKRGARAFYFKSPSSPRGKGRAIQTTLAKWRRKDGPASFLADMISLRRTLALCYHCGKYRLPRNWRKLFDYEELTRYHGVGHCDYCREEGSISMYLAGEGKYWQEHERAERHVAETQRRDQERYMKDKRYIIGV